MNFSSNQSGTLCKLQIFPITQILREIKFEDSMSLKTAFLQFQRFWILLLGLISAFKNCKKSFKHNFRALEMLILQFVEFQTMIHVIFWNSAIKLNFWAKYPISKDKLPILKTLKGPRLISRKILVIEKFLKISDNFPGKFHTLDATHSMYTKTSLTLLNYRNVH